jgi:hypothetical protein
MADLSKITQATPTPEQLEKIRTHQIGPGHTEKLVEFIQFLWKPKAPFFHWHKRTGALELHVGGNPANRQILHALRENSNFWNQYWIKAVSGEHYYFEINPMSMEKAKDWFKRGALEMCHLHNVLLPENWEEVFNKSL